MKKEVLIVLVVLFLTGCGNKEVKPVNSTNQLYQIHFPYKANVSENYVLGNISRYDLITVDNKLMKLSVKYFPPNNSLFEEGQYLKKDVLKLLLDKEHLNNTKVDVNGSLIDHNYISYIKEQNYISTNGNIKGIALAIALNSYVEVPGGNSTHEINLDELLKVGKEKAQVLVDYLYDNNKLSNAKIMVALYVIPNPNGTETGEFKMIGTNQKKTLEFHDIQYKTYYLTDNFVMDNDIVNYENFMKFKSNLNANFKESFIMGSADYINKITDKINININVDNVNNAYLMTVSQMVVGELDTLFNNIDVDVYLKFNNVTRTLITKENKTSKIYMMEE